MGHPYQKFKDAEHRRVEKIMPGATTLEQIGAIDRKPIRAPGPEKHSIAVPGGSIDLQRSYARGGAVRDVSIVLKSDDGREQRMRFADGEWVEPKPLKASASKGKLRTGKVVV